MATIAIDHLPLPVTKEYNRRFFTAVNCFSVDHFTDRRKILTGEKFNQAIFNFSSVKSGLVTKPEDDSIEEIDRYFKVNLRGERVDPYIWWKEHHKSFPVMAKLVRKYLAIPATSVA
ncbi:hypothetical protein BGZ65_009042, partial [Modicella reniformis]